MTDREKIEKVENFIRTELKRVFQRKAEKILVKLHIIESREDIRRRLVELSRQLEVRQTQLETIDRFKKAKAYYQQRADNHFQSFKDASEARRPVPRAHMGKQS